MELTGKKKKVLSDSDFNIFSYSTTDIANIIIKEMIILQYTMNVVSKLSDQRNLIALHWSWKYNFKT